MRLHFTVAQLFVSCFDVTCLSQVRWKEVSSLSSSAYHQRHYCFPQWGLVHPPEDSLQRPSHIPGCIAQRDHLGGWCQCCRCVNSKHAPTTNRFTDSLTGRYRKTEFQPERLGVQSHHHFATSSHNVYNAWKHIWPTCSADILSDDVKVQFELIMGILLILRASVHGWLKENKKKVKYKTISR